MLQASPLLHLPCGEFGPQEITGEEGGWILCLAIDLRLESVTNFNPY